MGREAQKLHLPVKAQCFVHLGISCALGNRTNGTGVGQEAFTGEKLMFCAVWKKISSMQSDVSTTEFGDQKMSKHQRARQHHQDTTETPPRHHRDTTKTPRHHQDTETPPRHRDTTKIPPRHHQDTETPPRYRRDTTETPPTRHPRHPRHHHRGTTKIPPRHHQDTTETLPRHHHRDTTTETPPRYHRDITETPPPRHHQDTTETPPRHHRDTAQAGSREPDGARPPLELTIPSYRYWGTILQQEPSIQHTPPIHLPASYLHSASLKQRHPATGVWRLQSHIPQAAWALQHCPRAIPQCQCYPRPRAPTFSQELCKRKWGKINLTGDTQASLSQTTLDLLTMCWTSENMDFHHIIAGYQSKDMLQCATSRN